MVCVPVQHKNLAIAYIQWYWIYKQGHNDLNWPHEWVNGMNACDKYWPKIFLLSFLTRWRRTLWKFLLMIFLNNDHCKEIQIRHFVLERIKHNHFNLRFKIYIHRLMLLVTQDIHTYTILNAPLANLNTLFAMHYLHSLTYVIVNLYVQNTIATRTWTEVVCLFSLLFFYVCCKPCTVCNKTWTLVNLLFSVPFLFLWPGPVDVFKFCP
jgi:hypothetical protein